MGDGAGLAFPSSALFFGPILCPVGLSDVLWRYPMSDSPAVSHGPVLCPGPPEIARRISALTSADVVKDSSEPMSVCGTSPNLGGPNVAFEQRK